MVPKRDFETTPSRCQNRAEIVSELSPGPNPLLTVIGVVTFTVRLGTSELFARHKESFLNDFEAQGLVFKILVISLQ